jgi:antitoxin VapB
MQTVKVFTLGKAQAVRIPVRYRFATDEVSIEKQGEALVLRPQYRTAGELFAAIRAKHGAIHITRPPQGELEPVEPLEI